MRDVFVLNGDTYLELDFRAMLDAHVRAKSQFSMAVCRVPDVARYGALELPTISCADFSKRDARARDGSMAERISSARRCALASASGAAFSFEQDLLVPEVGSIRPLAFRASGLFIDIGIPEDYARVQQLFSRRLAQ